MFLLSYFVHTGEQEPNYWEVTCVLGLVFSLHPMRIRESCGVLGIECWIDVNGGVLLLRVRVQNERTRVGVA